LGYVCQWRLLWSGAGLYYITNYYVYIASTMGIGVTVLGSWSELHVDIQLLYGASAITMYIHKTPFCTRHVPKSSRPFTYVSDILNSKIYRWNEYIQKRVLVFRYLAGLLRTGLSISPYHAGDESCHSRKLYVLKNPA